jgi:hypothetical protein
LFLENGLYNGLCGRQRRHELLFQRTAVELIHGMPLRRQLRGMALSTDVNCRETFQHMVNLGPTRRAVIHRGKKNDDLIRLSDMEAYRSAHIHLLSNHGTLLCYGHNAAHDNLAAFGGGRDPDEHNPKTTAVREFGEESLGVLMDHEAIEALLLDATPRVHVGRSDGGAKHYHYFVSTPMCFDQAAIDAQFARVRAGETREAFMENDRLVLMPVSQVRQQLLAQTSYRHPVVIAGAPIRAQYVGILRDFLGLPPP